MPHRIRNENNLRTASVSVPTNALYAMHIHLYVCNIAPYMSSIFEFFKIAFCNFYLLTSYKNLICILIPEQITSRTTSIISCILKMWKIIKLEDKKKMKKYVRIWICW